MQRTKIEWVVNPDGTQGYTWNPVTGCLHGCSYCYARKIAHRFNPVPAMNHDCTQPGNGLYEIRHQTGESFRYGFAPTFHTYRLSEPLRLKKPSTIFVCSIADLFGDWVPNEWINEILNIIKKCPDHTFFLLTKNPKRYYSYAEVFPANCMLGMSPNEHTRAFDVIKYIPGYRFVSLEPMLSDYSKDIDYESLNWIIVGSLNQNGSPVSPEKRGTKKEWVLNLLEQADKYCLPVFIKSELYQLYPDLPVRKELPHFLGK